MKAVTTTTTHSATPTRRPVAWQGIALPVLAIVLVTGIVLGLAAVRGIWNVEGTATPPTKGESALPGRLAAMDEALARGDLSRAVYEWRDAYGLALGSRRWEAMVLAGDAALRIDALAGRPPGPRAAFRAEARQAYLIALFGARRVGSREGVLRVAEAFAALGDVEMASRARAMAVER